MKNFLNQDIQVGDTVMRATTSGSTLLFEFGVVRDLVAATDKVKVDWYLRTHYSSESRKRSSAPLATVYGGVTRGTGVDIDKVVLSSISLQEFGVRV